MHCLSCHYDLENLTGNRCPECGRMFDPADDRTYQSPESARVRVPVNMILLLFVALAVGLPLVLFIVQVIQQMIWGY